MNYTLQNHFLAKIGRFFTRTTVKTPIAEKTNLFFLENLEQFDIIKIATADAVVIGQTDISTARALLQMLRSANQRRVYLKPIFIKSLALYESLQHQVDGWYQLNDMQQLMATAASINNRMQELESDATNRDIKSNVLRKTVQYLYTRKTDKLSPYLSETGTTANIYPFINSLFPTTKNTEVLQLLEIGVVEEWLEAAAIDTHIVEGTKIDSKAFKLTFAGEQLAKFGYYIAPKTIGLPEGILGLAPFQKLVEQELVHTQQNQHQSFLLELGLIQKNFTFLSAKAQEELALDCLCYLQKNGIAKASFGFTPSHQLWLLLPDFSDKAAIEVAEKAFASLQKMLREILDSTQPLLTLNMFRVQEALPVIQ
ncbi:MAG: hypothetical protein AB8G86_24100 [Saprospiraceae bacterium]